MQNNTHAGSRASSRGAYFNTGNGAGMVPVDIGHVSHVGLVDPDSAFWSLVKKENLADALSSGGSFAQQFLAARQDFLSEMHTLRGGLRPSAVYFNPTDLCNLNCTYCYIPEAMRQNGKSMAPDELVHALGLLKEYFQKTLPGGRKPQIVFHGAEPMAAREAVFAGIETYRDDFAFGVQTNGTLLDDSAIDFLTARGIGIGLSLDAPTNAVATRTRHRWDDSSSFEAVLTAIGKLRGYPAFNVIATVTGENMHDLVALVEFFHAKQVGVAMLNPVRCTRPGARQIRPADHELAPYYLAALDRTYELYQQTGRKLVIANFANVLVSIMAPSARRLMCDISPCGGGRCFFAVSASGDLFPCSEFVGVPEFRGGNLFDAGGIEQALASKPFQMVTGRRVEQIEPCHRCAIRHFCGSPCPAEAYEMNGGMDQPGAFCELYEEQVRYALRLLADERQDAYLWDGWDQETETVLEIAAL
jgi:uncharacterized protein